jgi:hypothetical protein
MNKIQVRPPPSGQQIEREYASSPCLMSHAEPDFGYWTREDDLTFLCELLKLERKGTKAFAALGKAADLHVADIALELELLQASLCVFLRAEIKARGGKASSPGKHTFTEVHGKLGLTKAISIAVANQQELFVAIQKARLKLFDPQLRAALVRTQSSTTRTSNASDTL